MQTIAHTMNGAEALVRTLVASGVDLCFANPGTSEMHFIAALDRVAKMRAVLCLFEGVVTGMADGYGRMTGRPAATLLHLGTGLAYGVANLHNARRAATPIVNIVGDHARTHLQHPSPFLSDVAAIARPVSDWVRASESSLALAADAAMAVAAARAPPGRIATLIVPADAAWEGAEGPALPLPRMLPAPVSDATIDRVAALLARGKEVAILLRGPSLTQKSLTAAGRIAARTGARILCERLSPRVPRGAGRVRLEQIPYRGDEAIPFLRSIEALVLVCAQPPVATFAYPGKPSWYLSSRSSLVYLAHPHEDGAQALEALADRVGAARETSSVAPFERLACARGVLDSFTIGICVARHLPEGAIISDESVTSSAGIFRATATAAPHDYLANTGGAIGQGLPVGAGAAMAIPNRKVVCLQADGSAMYTMQALWTMARESLDVTTVLFANRSYAILRTELGQVGASAGALADALLQLEPPRLCWTRLAEGMGIESSRAETIEQFDSQFADAMSRRGPRLIEVAL